MDIDGLRYIIHNYDDADKYSRYAIIDGSRYQVITQSGNDMIQKGDGTRYLIYMGKLYHMYTQGTDYYVKMDGHDYYVLPVKDSV